MRALAVRWWTAGGMALALGAALGAAAGAKPESAAARAPAESPLAGYRVLAARCLQCHGAAAMSGLDLRTRTGALKGGRRGPALVPGRPEASRLYLVLSGRAEPAMPPGPRRSPSGAKSAPTLPAAELAALRAWIRAGAPWPDAAASGGESRWWAFRPVKRPPVPALSDAWVRNPIDAFLLARLKQAGLRPNPPADRRTLLRRACFDLLGLPPTPEEVEAFLRDPSPDAWEKVVDRLLASPHYGERWGRHWLDLARFAESEGFKADETRPDAWRYRDWVIASLNADKPYDRFLMEQIAGDELWPDDPQALVATGFNRHWADESNARNLRLRRQEILNDITDTVGSVVLGLTLGCARCHDHKYDPIPQRDYYRFQAFFAAIQPRDDLPVVPPSVQAAHATQQARWEAATREVRERLAALEAPVRARLLREKRMPFPDDVQEAIDTPAERRTPLQWQLFLKVSSQIEVREEDVRKALPAESRAEWEALQRELAAFDSLKPPPLPRALGITDVGPEAPPTHVLAGGAYDQPREAVAPGFLSCLGEAEPAIRPPSARSTGRRAALAAWLASPQNPLTARVIVNRIWQHHFGEGIVRTPSDFGRTGEPPTHPELLDWLAAELIAQGWRLKPLHRLILTSAAYRQSSAFDPKKAARDPDNRLLWRYRRWRLEGEAIRDACLSVSGELNLKMGGPSVFPELPAGVSTRGGWPVTADPAERNRRSVYVFVRRNLRYPLFEAFDFPDTHEPCARRSVTNTAPQALMLLNGEWTLARAQAMAGRLLREAPAGAARIERAYRLAFGRAPDAVERRLSLEFLERQAALIRKRRAAGEPIALPAPAPDGLDPAEGAALVDLCHALLNSNEFLYVE